MSCTDLTRQTRANEVFHTDHTDSIRQERSRYCRPHPWRKYIIEYLSRNICTIEVEVCLAQYVLPGDVRTDTVLCVAFASRRIPCFKQAVLERWWGTGMAHLLRLSRWVQIIMNRPVKSCIRVWLVCYDRGITFWAFSFLNDIIRLLNQNLRNAVLSLRSDFWSALRSWDSFLRLQIHFFNQNRLLGAVWSCSSKEPEKKYGASLS